MMYVSDVLSKELAISLLVVAAAIEAMGAHLTLRQTD